ncbi:MAG: hypothetical protein P4M12_03695 [Gammaproteobacteria bacterium]|nr:hypothetical protein [Gammaproteobacteria bacterium]
MPQATSVNSADEEAPSGKTKRRRSPQNGGRNGFDDYPNSPIDVIENPYQSGSQCPCCSNGKLYEGEARQGIQYDASPLIQVKRHRKNVLRCNACGLEQVPGKSIPRHTNEARSAIVVERALGCYTSSICTQSNKNDIILYFTSNKYLAENFTGLLVQ